MTQGGDEGMWLQWEVVRKGSGHEGKWWWRGVVRKGGDGKWWGKEVVMTGSGDDGKWWGREVVRKGSGDEGKWWRWEAVTMGSGEEGKWWGREVVRQECNGCMNVAWAMLWGGSRSTKPCVFPCKVAAEVPPVCGGCGCGRSARDWFLLCVLQQVVVPVCVVLCVSWSCGCRSHWNGCMNVAWAMCWGGSRSTKPCVFPCKVAAGDDERYLVCAMGAAAVVPDAIGSFYVLCNKWLFLCA